jgi:hypothetical protein
MGARNRRSLPFVLAAVLLVGQGAGLQHHHASTAECPPGACLVQVREHVEAGSPSAQLRERNDCPLCELAAQGRTVTPAASVLVGHAPAGAAALLLAAPSLPPVTPTSAGNGPRAPPLAS